MVNKKDLGYLYRIKNHEDHKYSLMLIVLQYLFLKAGKADSIENCSCPCFTFSKTKGEVRCPIRSDRWFKFLSVHLFFVKQIVSIFFQHLLNTSIFMKNVSV